MHFVSPKAHVRGFLEGENLILGASRVGEKSIIGRNVIVGYPIRKSLESLVSEENFSVEELDRTSKGARIGKHCIIRSGSVVYENAFIGDQVETGHNVLIREGTVIGDRTRIGSSAQLDGVVKIGRNVSIQSNAYLPHLTVVEDNVFLAPNVVITNDPYPPSKRLIGTVVEREAIVGANAIIIARAKIGKGAVVGAGAIVTKDVPPNAVVIGAPARVNATRGLYNRKKAKWEKE